MSTCANCGNTVDPTDADHDIIAIRHGGKPSAYICEECSKGVQVLKVVLRREPDGHFGYDGFAALEMQKKAFGKSA